MATAQPEDQLVLSKSPQGFAAAAVPLTEAQKIAEPQAFQIMARHFPPLATFLYNEADFVICEEANDSDDAQLEARNRQHEAELLVFQSRKSGVDPNAPEENENIAPLGLAAAMGNKDMMGALLRAGADINAKNGERKYTALQMAIEQKQYEAAHWLLRHGANVASRDQDGNTPFIDLLDLDGDEGIRLAEAMLNVGANPDMKDQNQSPMIVLAARLGKQDMVKLLLRKGANPDAQDAKGLTAFGWASQAQDTEMARILLNAGADPTIMALGAMEA